MAGTRKELGKESDGLDWRRIVSLALLLVAATGSLQAQVSFLGTQSTLPAKNLTSPYGVVEDAAGNLYVSDPTLHQVACYTATGTACGAPFPMQQGFSQPKGMAIDYQGDLFVADAGAGTVDEIVHAASGYQAPVAIADSLTDPEALTLDTRGNLYVALTSSGEVVELTWNGVQFLAPQVLFQGLTQPDGIAIDNSFTLYIAQQSGIWISILQNGIFPSLVEFMGLPGVNGQHGVPGSLTLDASMVLYVTVQSTAQVIAYQLRPPVPHPVAAWYIGTGFQTPGQVAVNSSGDAVIADSGRGTLVDFSRIALPFAAQAVGSAVSTQRFLFDVASGASVGAVNLSTAGATQGDFQSQSGSDCQIGTYATETTCSILVGFAPQSSGARSGAISFWDDSGHPLQTTYIYGVGVASRTVMLPATVTPVASGLAMPTGVAVDGAGNVYVSDAETFTISRIGSSVSTIPMNAVNTPLGIAVDGAGNLLVASSGNDRVIRMAWNGTAFTDQQSVGSGMYVPSGVAVQPNGAMCVANTYEDQVNCYNWTGTGYVPQPPGQNFAQTGTFYTYFPVSTAIDVQGDVFWAQPYQNQVLEFFSSSNLIEKLWQGSFQYPTAVAVDGEGNLYVLDSGHNRVMMLVPRNGVYQKPVAVAAGFNAPQGLAVDAAGNLYVADTGNHRVVKITMTQPAPLSFAPAGSGHTSSSGVQSAAVWSVGSAASSVISVSYPPDFPAATGNGSSCVAGMTLAPGSSCLVSVSFQPTQAGMQFNESATVQLQMANGQMQTIAIPLQGNSLNLAAQTIQFPVLPQLVYGQQMQGDNTTVALQATASSGLPVRYQVLSGPGVLAGSGNLLQVLGAGTIVVQATQPGNGSFAAASAVQQSIIVLPATLTVTASSQRIAYGGSASSFGYTITGFVAGDTSAVVSGNPVITTSAGAHPAAGSYPIQISAGTLSAPNYTFAFVPGTLQVTPAQLQVVATSITSVYGQPLPPFSYTLSGFVGGDTAASVHGQPGFVTAATSSSPVGSYMLAPQQGSLTAANYSFHFVSGTVQITPGLLTVAASNLTIVYGSSMPTLSYTVSGFRNGDTAAQSVSGTAVLTTSYRPGFGVGAYPIQIAQGTLSAKNYTLQLQAGTLTVSAAMLYLQPDSKTMEIGQPLPTLTYQALGLVAGDTLATATTGAPLLSTSATPQSLPGFYGILIAQGTMRAPNYQLYFGEGLMDVVWSTNDPVNPPGVFVPPPVRLRGNPILPLHAPAPQITLPNGSLFGARQAASGSSVAGNWPASSWTAGSPGSFIGSYASPAAAWMAPAAANTGSSPCAATPQAASAPADARPADANAAAPTPPPSAQSANAYCAADAP